MADENRPWALPVYAIAALVIDIGTHRWNTSNRARFDRLVDHMLERAEYEALLDPFEEEEPDA